MEYQLSLKGLKEKKIYSLDENFSGISVNGEEISFTNYYMQKNKIPFFGVSGEIHFSRMSDTRWEDELLKMKMNGINLIATYVFWIHHEEEEGIFDFTGCRNLRKFVQLCAKYGLYVILRVGPFDHGEVRNGGIPDWIYGKPFEPRKLSDGFLYHTRRLYEEIGKQISGMFFRDGGPIIGVQIDNEYMHSSARWEMTTGTSDEWVFGGDEGDTYMLCLKELAAECGLTPVFYTCTAWGGASTPESMLPLWGGYAFRPWMISSPEQAHPATDEYVYQNFHDNSVITDYDFKPHYRPEEKPYACCEMGAGMNCCYNYRFQYPYKSVDAMANIKIGSGCNFLGYYMFHGGSNPLGRHGMYMNECESPKISYDYQAALGEFGQVRESYQRLKAIHFFVREFGDRLCRLATVLPEGASSIVPKDTKSLRYAVRTDGKRGFLFLNNYQDHIVVPDRKDDTVTLHLDDEDISFHFDIASEENAILPFHFDLGGIELIFATAQPVTRVVQEDKVTYVFMVPDGMHACFQFETGVCVNEMQNNSYVGKKGLQEESFIVAKGDISYTILLINREMANRMYQLSNGGLVFTESALLENENEIRLETTKPVNDVYTYPKDLFAELNQSQYEKDGGLLGRYRLETEEKKIDVEVEHTVNGKYILRLQQDFLKDLKDARLRIFYSGDIGTAFLNGRMIHDNFANGAVWEIGLKEYQQELEKNNIIINITPIREGAKVIIDSPMAARREEVKAYIGELKNVEVQPVYELSICDSI